MKISYNHDSSSREKHAAFSYRQVAAAVLSVLLNASGCALHLGSGSSDSEVLVPGSTVAVDVENAQSAVFDRDVEQDSEAMHNFLVGQLSFGMEDFEGALKHFERADQLSTESSAFVNSKLADLYVRFGDLEKAERAAKKAMEVSPTEPYVRMLYAGVLEVLGRDSEAEPIYRGLIAEFPHKIEGYLLLSNLYVKGKNYEQAEQVLTDLVKNQPREPTGRFYLGRMYEHQGKLDKAQAEYSWVFEHDPNLSNGSTELLRVLVRQGKTAAVKRVCERIISKDPNNSLARKVLGHIMIGESKLDDALQHFTALESLEEDPTDTRFKVALIQIEKQNYREAISELSLVLASNPSHAEARYYLASLYAGTGRRKEALAELDAIAKESPMFVKARTFAAFILRQDDELSDALDAVEDALEVEPTNLNLALYRVLILRNKGEYRAAEKQLLQLIEDHPADERVRFNLAVVLHERGKVRDAVREMEHIVAENPNNTDALNFIAYAYAEEGRELERAEQLVVRALELKPNDGYYLDTLGYIYYKRGMMPQAAETLARAVSLTGQDPVIIQHYADVLLAQGKREDAVRLLASVADLELTGDDLRDKEKVQSLKEIKQMLRDLKKQYPELRDAQGERLRVSSRANHPRPLIGMELLNAGGTSLSGGRMQ